MEIKDQRIKTTNETLSGALVRREKEVIFDSNNTAPNTGHQDDELGGAIFEQDHDTQRSRDWLYQKDGQNVFLLQLHL